MDTPEYKTKFVSAVDDHESITGPEKKSFFTSSRALGHPGTAREESYLTSKQASSCAPPELHTTGGKPSSEGIEGEMRNLLCWIPYVVKGVDVPEHRVHKLRREPGRHVGLVSERKMQSLLQQPVHVVHRSGGSCGFLSVRVTRVLHRSNRSNPGHQHSVRTSNRSRHTQQDIAQVPEHPPIPGQAGLPLRTSGSIRIPYRLAAWRSHSKARDKNCIVRWESSRLNVWNTTTTLPNPVVFMTFLLHCGPVGSKTNDEKLQNMQAYSDVQCAAEVKKTTPLPYGRGSPPASNGTRRLKEGSPDRKRAGQKRKHRSV